MTPFDVRMVAKKEFRSKVAPRSARPAHGDPIVAFTPERRERWNRLTKNSPFNIWLKRQTSGSDGNIDLEKLYSVARTWGVQERYEHLNPGMIRMNIGNKLRALVPRSMYENEKD
jgi:hypothetical protein